MLPTMKVINMVQAILHLVIPCGVQRVIPVLNELHPVGLSNTCS